MSEISVKICQLCSAPQPSLKYLLKHIRQVHVHKQYFRITCHLSGCTRVIHTFEVFRNHVYDFHSDSETMPTTVSSTDDVENEFEDDTSGDSPTSSFPPPDRIKAAAMWILKIQETFKAQWS